MRLPLTFAAIALFTASGFGQGFEASASFGRTLFGGTKFAGTVTEDPNSPHYEFSDGFHFALRMTINSYRFIGYEFGYAYNRTSIRLPSGTPIGTTNTGQELVTTEAQKVSLPIHQGLANLLLYATPEGARIRPFVTGGGNFNSFVPPGSSISYGNQTTKFGFNYGAGVKVRTTDNWGFRVDARAYEGPKPYQTFNIRGRLRLLELSAGISFFM
jgi:opacity protein-like surface antigen